MRSSQVWLVIINMGQNLSLWPLVVLQSAKVCVGTAERAISAGDHYPRSISIRLLGSFNTVQLSKLAFQTLVGRAQSSFTTLIPTVSFRRFICSLMCLLNPILPCTFPPQSLCFPYALSRIPSHHLSAHLCFMIQLTAHFYGVFFDDSRTQGFSLSLNSWLFIGN